MKEKEESILKGRLLDLSERSKNRDIFTFSDFLGLSEQSVLASIKRSLISYRLFGGTNDSERVMVRFGDVDALGYEEDFPISCILLSPVLSSGEISYGHRDVLGSLMGLGIKRELLGDIVIRDRQAYIFCRENIAEFICENLCQVRRDMVSCKIYTGDLDEAAPRKMEEQTQVASLRLDVLLSKVFKLSRGDSQALIKEGRAFINGREIKSDSKNPVEGDIISLRGHGRFQFDEVCGNTKKGNLIIRIYRFV